MAFAHPRQTGLVQRHHPLDQTEEAASQKLGDEATERAAERMHAAEAAAVEWLDGDVADYLLAGDQEPSPVATHLRGGLLMEPLMNPNDEPTPRPLPEKRRQPEGAVLAVGLVVLALLLVVVPKTPSGIAYAFLIAAFVYGAGVAAFIRPTHPKS